MFTLMLADIFTVDCAGVADVAAVVEMRIGVKNFAIHPRSADANAVVGARNRREITDDNHLTGVFIALLTVYDMCKSMDKGMEITGVRLLEKTGGKSGAYSRS